jgi:hypothetical protein
LKGQISLKAKFLPNSSSEIPNPKQIPSTKFQKKTGNDRSRATGPLVIADRCEASFGAWDLVLVWDLGFGIWNLEFGISSYRIQPPPFLNFTHPAATLTSLGSS